MEILLLLYFNFNFTYKFFNHRAKEVNAVNLTAQIPYILTYRSHHRIGRTISFVLKKLNLALTRT